MPRKAFELVSPHTPVGDQPRAIESLCASIGAAQRYQTLLGVTGSGKTFSMANVIARLNRPTLIMAPNKTLAAQLYGEFRKFFPNNAVEYFVSFYDYYQPEAYVPRTDTYIEKDLEINERIDRMRHSATRSLLDRQDVVIVASVSCIYGLGSPEAYAGMLVYAEKGNRYPLRDMMRKLIDISYKRNDYDLKPGCFRSRGDTLDINPMYEDGKVLRIEFFGDEIDNILEIDPLTGEIFGELDKTTIYPASHYVTPLERIKAACDNIRTELNERVGFFNKEGKLLEAQRLEQRTNYDMEALEQTGTCFGVENYSRHLEGREPGSKPPTLMDYLPKNALLMIDESHITVPQIGGMYKGDRARKTTLVDYGFRLPSALDNRPLKFEEFEAIDRPTVFVSATPGPYELRHCGVAADSIRADAMADAVSRGLIAQQIIRPTGLIDPPITVKPVKGQVDDILEEIRITVARGERVLVCTLTKRMAEELTEYMDGLGIRVRYLHSEIDTIERTELLRGLRKGDFDVLVGINLLREGLDLPEVALIAVMDADKEGYLRSARSLIQIVGRAARNINGKVVFYADKITGSMAECMGETDRRRAVQSAFNEAHGITPRTVYSPLQESLHELCDSDFSAPPVSEETVAETMRRAKGRHNAHAERSKGRRKAISPEEADSILAGIIPEEFRTGGELNIRELPRLIKRLKADMETAARALEFEKAALIRDELRELEKVDMELRV
jgi:excinuclease ABC subunit B